MVKYMIGKVIKKEKELKSYYDLIEEGNSFFIGKKKIDIDNLKEQLIYILINTFNIDKKDYLFNLNNKNLDIKKDSVLKNKYKKYIKNIKKRLKNIPFQYIFNKAYFYGREFYVNKNVLIPRFDTEVLVRQVIDFVKSNNKKYNILDLCTGQGVILITLLKEISNNINKIYGIDISKKALNVLNKNMIFHNINNQNVYIIKSNLFDKLSKVNFKNGSNLFDIIVCNPPYINKKDYNRLDKEVKKYEPKLALLGGDDGLYYYRKILKNAKKFLSKTGKIFFEIGYDEASSIFEIAKNYNYRSCKVINDFNNINRVIEISI